MKQESARDRILLHFKLGKELSEEYIKGGNKYNKTIARRIYQNFAKMYPQISYNKKWKLGHFKEMSVKDTEEIIHNWISTELNPIEGENMWLSQDQSMETQQNDQQDLQITLQEVIDMISSFTTEETIGSNEIQEEMIGSNEI